MSVSFIRITFHSFCAQIDIISNYFYLFQKKNRWHLITIGIIPPKRPFAYTQILTYVDGQQTLGATIKFGTFTEPFSNCTIGMAPNQNIRRSSNNGTNETDNRLQTSSSIDSAAAGSGSSKGMIPSLIERSFFSQVFEKNKKTRTFAVFAKHFTNKFHEQLSGGKLFFVTIAEYIIK